MLAANIAPPHFVILDDLAVHRAQKVDLLADKLLDSRRVVLAVSARAISHLAAHVLKSVLEHFKAVLGVLLIQLLEVRDTAHCGKYCVVLDHRCARPK